MVLFAAALGGSLVVSAPACAWGFLGHEVTAEIAWRHLTPTARARLTELLHSDPDTISGPTVAARATWADLYRKDHRETSEWHFADVELDAPDLGAACYGFPVVAPGAPASAGPAKDCVAHKIDQFAAELADPRTSEAERLYAYKFLVHFVGDVHQPLHAADSHDRGGNCVEVAGAGGAKNLHSFWDTGAVQQLGGSADEIAAALDAKVTPRQLRTWSAGDPRQWTMESFAVARKSVYHLPVHGTCETPGAPVVLDAAYQAAAREVVAVQLQKAGVRLAYVLNRALG